MFRNQFVAVHLVGVAALLGVVGLWVNTWTTAKADGLDGAKIRAEFGVLDATYKLTINGVKESRTEDYDCSALSGGTGSACSNLVDGASTTLAFGIMALVMAVPAGLGNLAILFHDYEGAQRFARPGMLMSTVLFFLCAVVWLSANEEVETLFRGVFSDYAPENVTVSLGPSFGLLLVSASLMALSIPVSDKPTASEASREPLFLCC